VRYQEGRVVLVGKHFKKWRGHFYVDQRQADGSEVRRFRNVHLGLKSEIDKGQARTMLRDMIARETRDVAPAPVAVTLRWFYENRFLPQKEQQWKVTSRPKTKRFIENYLLKRFGDIMLSDLHKFALQTYLNGRVTGVHLTPEQIPVVLFNLSDRDCLIVRMFLVLGLRPGELFALRWNDKAQNSLRIDSSITDGIEVEIKTEGTTLVSGFPFRSIQNWSGGNRPARTPPQMHSFFPQRGAPRSTPTISFSGSSRKQARRPASLALRTRCSDARVRRIWLS
jgi:integrase